MGQNSFRAFWLVRMAKPITLAQLVLNCTQLMSYISMLLLLIFGEFGNHQTGVYHSKYFYESRITHENNDHKPAVAFCFTSQQRITKG